MTKVSPTFERHIEPPKFTLRATFKRPNDKDTWQVGH